MSEENITQPENSEKPQPVVEETSAIPKKKKFSNMMWLVTGLVLLIILGASGYFLVSSSSKGTQNNNSISTVSTPTATSVPTQVSSSDLSSIRTCSVAFTSQNGKYVINDCKYADHGKPENLGKNDIEYFTLNESGAEKASYIVDYAVSPDQKKVFYGVVADVKLPPLDFASGSPSDVQVNLFILDLSSGNLTALTQDTFASFYTDRIARELKQNGYYTDAAELYSKTGRESAWSTDSKGIVYDGGDTEALYYCTTACKKILDFVGHARQGEPPAPYFLDNKIYYIAAENGDAVNGKSILKSMLLP